MSGTGFCPGCHRWKGDINTCPMCGYWEEPEWVKEGHKPEPTDVDGVHGAVLLLALLIDKDLRNPNIFSNAFGLEVFEDGEWCEWHDDNSGDDILAIMDAEEGGEK